MISLENFLELPTERIADLVRQKEEKVVVFPINGTRRWFMFEHGEKEYPDPILAYMDISTTRHIELYKLFFDHGVGTLLTPVIGQEILETRDAYMEKIGQEGLSRLASHPEMLAFYNKYDVKVRFYGEYKKYLYNTTYQSLISLFEQVEEKTKNNKSFRLFFGA
ncbi:MAG TPA: hypothetical protein DCX54_05790, partial [Flavobacteriales bacterium]|nr:hypothetical protein [Flavobacteriales bacterium]